MRIKDFYRPKVWSIFMLLLVCASCHLGPNYHPPCTDIPEEWKGSQEVPPATPIPCITYWWEVFDDEILNDLEHDAIDNSPNLYVALQRVLQARALANIRRADLFPQVTLDPNYLDMGSLFKLFIPPNVGPFTTAGGDVFRVHQFQYNLPLNLSYELDLWGELQGQYDSALMSAEAQQQAFNTTLLSLTTDLASSYFLIRSLDAQIAFFKDTVIEFRKAYELTQSRFDKGLANYVDVAKSSLQLTNVESDLFDLLRQRVLQEDKIAVLLGRPPSAFCLEPDPLTGQPPVVPAGIPSDILLQRPDIAQAERTMASQHALIGVAYASMFPSIQLTGTLGFSSPTLKDFLKWISRLWAFGVNTGQPVYDGGRIDGNIDLAWARFREANGTYQQQVITAFQEVEDALNNLEMQSKQAESLTLSTQSAKKAVDLSLNRYKNGLTGYLDVVDSQRSYLEAERNLITLQGVRYLSTVQLIKALGGSWNYSCE